MLRKFIAWRRRAHVLLVTRNTACLFCRKGMAQRAQTSELQAVNSFLEIRATSNLKRNLQRRPALLIQTHSRIHVQFAQSNRPPPASHGDIHNPVVNARKRHRLNLLPTSQDQRELALIRQGFRLFQRNSLVVGFQLLHLLRLSRRTFLRRDLPVLTLALALVLSLLSRLRIRVRIQVSAWLDWQHIRPAAIQKDEPVGRLRLPPHASFGKRQLHLRRRVDQRLDIVIFVDRSQMCKIESVTRERVQNLLHR
jgi:hypothetical protein